MELSSAYGFDKSKRCTPQPNHFDDNFIHDLYVDVLSKRKGQSTFNYRATFGCIIKLKKALSRLIKRQLIPELQDEELAVILHTIARRLTNNAPVLNTWNPKDLQVAIYILEEKQSVLSGGLKSVLDREPLFPPLHSLAEDGTPLLSPGSDSVQDSAATDLGCNSCSVLPVQQGHVFTHSTQRGRKKPPVCGNRTLLFRQRFIEQVNSYHLGVKRPVSEDPAGISTTVTDTDHPSPAPAVIFDAGTGADGSSILSCNEGKQSLVAEDSRVAELAVCAREICGKCKGKRQIYCGGCGGLRMDRAGALLPARVDLPFDVLLALHWQESLHKCTGIHSRVLATESHVDYVHWEKDQWGPLVDSWSADRDVLLFPTDDAIDAGEFQWESCAAAVDAHAGSDKSQLVGVKSRYRLIVLEASWNYGATMARQIMEYRAERGLPPLRCIKLSNIVGRYWRFQEFGHAAVSTIEAITCAVIAAMQSNFESSAAAANACVDVHGAAIDRVQKDMLVLFNLQKYRVLDNVASHGGKAPRAMKVQGEGDATWANVFVLKEEGNNSNNCSALHDKQYLQNSHTAVIDSVAALSSSFIAGEIYNNVSC